MKMPSEDLVMDMFSCPLSFIILVFSFLQVIIFFFFFFFLVSLLWYWRGEGLDIAEGTGRDLWVQSCHLFDRFCLRFTVNCLFLSLFMLIFYSLKSNCNLLVPFNMTGQWQGCNLVFHWTGSFTPVTQDHSETISLLLNRISRLKDALTMPVLK